MLNGVVQMSTVQSKRLKAVFGLTQNEAPDSGTVEMCVMSGIGPVGNTGAHKLMLEHWINAVKGNPLLMTHYLPSRFFRVLSSLKH